MRRKMYYVGAIGKDTDLLTTLYIASCDIGESPSGDDPVIMSMDAHRTKAVAWMNDLRRRCDALNA